MLNRQVTQNYTMIADVHWTYYTMARIKAYLNILLLTMFKENDNGTKRFKLQ